MEPHERMQDHRDKWYWIPNRLVRAFRKHLGIIQKDDLKEDSTILTDFDLKYSDYLTGGDRNAMPDIYR